MSAQCLKRQWQLEYEVVNVYTGIPHYDYDIAILNQTPGTYIYVRKMYNNRLREILHLRLRV